MAGQHFADAEELMHVILRLPQPLKQKSGLGEIIQERSGGASYLMA